MVKTSSVELARAGRLADLARHCREVAEWTAVPEVAHEIEKIALSLDEVAGSIEPKISSAAEKCL